MNVRAIRLEFSMFDVCFHSLLAFACSNRLESADENCNDWINIWIDDECFDAYSFNRSANVAFLICVDSI